MASQAYRDIIVLEPVRARSYYLMGIAAGSLGRQAEAEIYLRNALRINVHYVEALHNLGTPLYYIQMYMQLYIDIRVYIVACISIYIYIWRCIT